MPCPALPQTHPLRCSTGEIRITTHAPKTPKIKPENAQPAFFHALGYWPHSNDRRRARVFTDCGVLDDSIGPAGTCTRFQVGKAGLSINHDLAAPFP